jgi:4-amino-4-deoxy-L-arabinose transferase-like glycosyltransferase
VWGRAGGFWAWISKPLRFNIRLRWRGSSSIFSSAFIILKYCHALKSHCQPAHDSLLILFVLLAVPCGLMKNILYKLALPALTLLTFFCLLGNRPLNEPDEGRYAEVAREMIETGDWLVPHFWYMPHLDKPPMTYWLVGASMKIFGQNEWAVRLPVALAGVSGVWAAFCLGYAMGGRRVGLWSALILQTSVLYFVMARMLTTDIFLTQFTAWAIYFFWRSWTAIESNNDVRKAAFFGWHFAGWIAVALGFLTKGPVALAIAAASLAGLLVFRRGKISGTLLAGIFAGFALFLIIAAPWFLYVFQQVPLAAHYMILGQAAGHLLGTTIKNRTGIPGYFFGILAAGLLPWTLLLGWLWRRGHWRGLSPQAKEGWVLLNVWAIFTFILFSLSHAKLPPYILPIFPALAVMLAWRFFGEVRADERIPKIFWQIGLAVAVMPLVGFPFVILFLLRDAVPLWIKLQVPVAAVVVILVFVLSKKWPAKTIAAVSIAMVLLSAFVTVGELPLFPLNFKANEPLNQIGQAIRENYRPGEAIVCMGNIPQGLPFYCGGAISATNRPYFCQMDLKKVPFEFPGNIQRFGSLYLEKHDLAELLHSPRGVLVLSFNDAVTDFEKKHNDIPLREIVRSGQWVLYGKDPGSVPSKPAASRTVSTVHLT